MVSNKTSPPSYILTSGDNSLISSVLSVGTCLGALFGSTVGVWVGRRWGIIIYIMLFFIAVALQTAPTNLAGFCIGRVFADLGVEINANLEHDRKTGKARWSDCLKQSERKSAQRIGTALQALQQLTGLNITFYYGTAFFRNSGITNPFMITIATNVDNTGATPIGMWAADKVGRRNLMTFGAAGMGVCHFIVAATGTAISADNQVGQKVLIAFVCIFIAFFATTWPTLAWVITSESYPYELRGRGRSLSTATQWLFNFAIGYATPYLIDEGPGNAGLGFKVFFIWGGCCALASVFVFFISTHSR